MKANRFYLGFAISGLVFAGLTQSCVSDAPFDGLEGEGTLRMQVVLNSNLTRGAYDEDSLLLNSIIYISGQEGLLHKFQGFDKVPASIPMKSGNYTAEAWAGDSVTASFDKKFFRGFKPFTITRDNNTSVVLTCRIANVVASVNAATIDPTLMKDWTITVSNSRGSLVFNEENMAYAKGYFMMPNADIKTNEAGEYQYDDQGWPLYTNLSYKIEGTAADGRAFSREGIIQGSKGNGIVEHAHDYQLNISYHPDYEDEGGQFVTVTVNDKEDVEDKEIGLYSRPDISGVGFDIEDLVSGTEGNFTDRIVKVSGFGDLNSILVTIPDYEAMGLDAGEFDLRAIVPEREAYLNSKGLKWDYSRKESRNLAVSYITFSKAFLDAIPEAEKAYVITIKAADSYGKERTSTLRIGVGDVTDDPIILQPVDENNLMSVLSRRATVKGHFATSASNAGIEYRKAGTDDEWTFVGVPQTRASVAFEVVLENLDPDCEYEYRPAAENYVPSEDMTFTFRTEPEFDIPNKSMEDWSDYTSTIRLPGADGKRTFWDTGNHGSSTMKVTLTDGSDEMVHTGKLAAKLNSKYVGLGGIAGKLAAGNLFVGEYVRTSGTNGIIDFGREYDGSHPDALKVYVNYRPVKVTHPKTHLSKEDLDNAQIYVAFTTEKIQVNTGDQSTLFNKDDARVLGYGEMNFTENYGNDGELKETLIRVDWKKSAETTKPLYMIIVCSASRYGDYFEGGDGSIMFVDDFELVY